ncbi:hypothetical protein [Agromyces sp. M3QZ16-3]|uniref:hypothetical protein n=1 Tax=Agromyces sp. M3QZ16-3 TaxID=3447585 RepID=UPI003F691FCD
MATTSPESLESDEDIHRGMAVLERIGLRMHGLEDLSRPSPGSILAVEDQLVPYEPASHLVRHYDGVARDNLQAVTDVALAALEDPRNSGLPSFALYSQLRGSIEATGWAHWLILPSPKAKRLLRAMQITYGHAEDFGDTIRNLGLEFPSEARKERLIQIKDEIPQLRQRKLTRPPTTTAMLRESGSILPPHPLSALNAWKLCSGMAHGSRPVVYNLSERRQLAGPDEHGSVALQLQVRIGWVATIAKLADDFITATRGHYLYLASHDHAGRPVLP